MVRALPQLSPSRHTTHRLGELNVNLLQIALALYVSGVLMCVACIPKVLRAGVRDYRTMALVIFGWPAVLALIGWAFICFNRDLGRGRDAPKLIALLALCAAGALAPKPAAAQAAVTKDGYFACLTEQYLDDVLSFAAAKDLRNIDAYIQQRKCVIMKGDLKVTIVNWGFTVHQFAFEGIKLWTVSEGLKLR